MSGICDQGVVPWAAPQHVLTRVARPHACVKAHATTMWRVHGLRSAPWRNHPVPLRNRATARAWGTPTLRAPDRCPSCATSAAPAPQQPSAFTLPGSGRTLLPGVLLDAGAPVDQVTDRQAALIPQHERDELVTELTKQLAEVAPFEVVVGPLLSYHGCDRGSPPRRTADAPPAGRPQDDLHRARRRRRALPLVHPALHDQLRTRRGRLRRGTTAAAAGAARPRPAAHRRRAPGRRHCRQHGQDDHLGPSRRSPSPSPRPTSDAGRLNRTEQTLRIGPRRPP